MLCEHPDGITTYQPLGSRDDLESATPGMAAVYAVRCARIAARLHWKPWPQIFTQALRVGLRGLRETVGELYMTTIYPEIEPLRGPYEKEFTLRELAARCIDGVGYTFSHYHEHLRVFRAFRGAPDWLIGRCWYACQNDDASLRQLRRESVRHLIHVWRGSLAIVPDADVDLALAADSEEAARQAVCS